MENENRVVNLTAQIQLPNRYQIAAVGVTAGCLWLSGFATAKGMEARRRIRAAERIAVSK